MEGKSARRGFFVDPGSDGEVVALRVMEAVEEAAGAENKEKDERVI